MTSLDIVLPCYNPQKGWADTIRHNLQALTPELNAFDWQLHLVNDGSVNSFFEAERTQLDDLEKVNIISYTPNKGKGHALRKAVSLSEADAIIYTDVDFPYTVESFTKVLHALHHADVVLSRREEQYYNHLPASRKFISKVLKGVIKTVMRFDFTDTQAGLKGFTKKAKEHFLSTTSNHYLFDLEFVKNISRDKTLKCKVITAELKEGVVFSQMPVKVLMRESLSLLRIMLK